MPAFLPFLTPVADDANDSDEQAQAALLRALHRIGPVLVPASALLDPRHSAAHHHHEYYALADPRTSAPELVTQLLDNGAQKVVVPTHLVKALANTIPSQRLLLYLELDGSSMSTISDRLRDAVSGVFLQMPSYDNDLVSSIKQFFANADIYVYPTKTTPLISDLKASGATLVIPSSNLTLDHSSQEKVNVADAFLAPLTSDRPDNLFPTVVTSAASGRNLGLVYSSHESVRESIITGKGVYQSRKHGLWRKGETSGATQEVVTIRADCDNDALEFNVIQSGSGFCHTGSASCFGPLTGLAALEQTLLSRLQTAPLGSYTRRLFNDPDLLEKKIREEAEELIQASTKDEIAFEAADLIYFVLTKCIGQGVQLADVEACLDEKAKKVTRRPGNAKPQYSAPLVQPPPATNGVTTNGVNHTNGPIASLPGTPPPPVPRPDRIEMRQITLDNLSTAERKEALLRPVIKSEEMMAKVKPIVNEVRKRGDPALVELTAKYDKANLSEVVIRPPFFDPDTKKALDGEVELELDPVVREAINVAYDNVQKFHEAQLSSPLVVTTTPGVTCSRFAKPISRVALYVPGGTAVLPSTALMLGVPAQVAGCKQIIIATPPRSSGQVSPEVLYVAHLVGATAILKAGGAQAIAALAYGTQTVPKVDKIFGPGNQWVTAAKMLVQNDAEALVSIDMPAGPSEVLVVADKTANPSFVAADLLSQAEHGVDSQVVVVGVDLSDEHVRAIEDEVDRQAHELPRLEIVRESVRKSLVVRAKDARQAMQFSNDYAPEHLIIQTEDAKELLELVENAGSVFIGHYTPESCGDYASGTNHTLPTNGFARQYSGVNTQSFQKHITSQEITPDGLKNLGGVVTCLADCEGLSAHANAVRIRLKELKA